MHLIKIKNIFSSLSLLIMCAVIFCSCRHEPGMVYIPEPPAPLQPCDSTKVYFVNDVMPYVNSSCAVPGCHDNKGPAAGIDLSNYDAIMNAAVRDNKIVKPGDPLNSKFCRVLFFLDLIPMPAPFNYQLSQQAKSNFVKWVQDSAKNTACLERCDTLNFTYRRDIVPLINKYCTGCHFGNYNSGNVLLTNYVQIKALADSNKLYQSITATEGVRKMPTGVVTMQPCEIIQIRKWIEAGTPNN